MTTKEFYDYILTQMTAEQALMKFIEGGLLIYEKLKFESLEAENGEKIQNAVHPIHIVSMAAMDMDWQIAIEKDQEHIRGLSIGTQDYMDAIFPPEKPPTVNINKI